jgi:hypothetical protein
MNCKILANILDATAIDVALSRLVSLSQVAALRKGPSTCAQSSGTKPKSEIQDLQNNRPEA